MNFNSVLSSLEEMTLSKEQLKQLNDVYSSHKSYTLTQYVNSYEKFYMAQFVTDVKVNYVFDRIVTLTFKIDDLDFTIGEQLDDNEMYEFIINDKRMKNPMLKITAWDKFSRLKDNYLEFHKFHNTKLILQLANSYGYQSKEFIHDSIDMMIYFITDRHLKLINSNNSAEICFSTEQLCSESKDRLIEIRDKCNELLRKSNKEHVIAHINEHFNELGQYVNSIDYSKEELDYMVSQYIELIFDDFICSLCFNGTSTI